MGILTDVGWVGGAIRNIEWRERKSREKVKVNYRDADSRYQPID